jgi:transcriptional regulator with XRE-family HTH domain
MRAGTPSRGRLVIGAGAPGSSVTTRRQLVAELRRLRAAAELNQRQVAEALDWSASKIHRIEKGEVSISVTDLRALLGYYGVTDRATVADLVELAKAARKRALPFSAFRDVLPPDTIRFLGYEETASSVTEVELLAVPGLLQTEEYTRAWLSDVQGIVEPRAERLVASRRERQRLLTDPRSPRLTFLLDESVLHRAIGGPDVMAAQLRWLGQVADLPDVSIRVLPFSAGGHPGLRGSFVFLTFPEPNTPDVVHMEGRRGDMLFRDEPAVIDAHRRLLDDLLLRAAEPARLGEYLRIAENRMRGLTR